MNNEKPLVTANISNRHAHVSETDLHVLFGEGSALTPMRDLMQPGQFACNETITIATDKSEIPNVRIIGPTRKYTQVEVSATDARHLKLEKIPPVRDSGNLEGSSPITIIGPKGRIDLRQGCIIAKRHIHLHTEDAKKLGVSNMQLVNVRAGRAGDKTLVFEKMLCRVADSMAFECHIDTDEANACGLKNGEKVEILL